MPHVSENYGSMVFNEHTMQERLPSATYKSLLKTIREGKPLDLKTDAHCGGDADREAALRRLRRRSAPTRDVPQWCL